MYYVKDLKFCDHYSHLQDKLYQYSSSPSLPLPMEPKNVVNRFIFRVMAHSLNALKYSWVNYEVGPVSIYQKKAT